MAQYIGTLILGGFIVEVLFLVLSIILHLGYWKWKGEYDETLEEWNVLIVLGIVVILIPLFTGIFTGEIFDSTLTDLIPILMYTLFGFLAIIFIFLGSKIARKIALLSNN